MRLVYLELMKKMLCTVPHTVKNVRALNKHSSPTTLTLFNFFNFFFFWRILKSRYSFSYLSILTIHL